ncbi:MAG: peptidase MA family metallohydrolase [Anaerolineales bacterium]
MEHTIRKWVYFFFLLVQISARPFQSTPDKLNLIANVSYLFEKNIEISGRITPNIPIQDANLILETSPSANIKIPLNLDAQQNFSQLIDLATNPIIPFSLVKYYIEVQLQDGSLHRTQPLEFRYLDNRSIWQSTAYDIFIIHWQTNTDPPQNLLIPILQQSTEKIQTLYPAFNLDKTDIFLYNSTGELRQAMPTNQVDWMAAHAEPAVHVILLANTNAADDAIQLRRQIPHELMHLYLWQLSAGNYSNIPLWLNEGLATLVELSPNPEYSSILEDAAKNRSLLSFKDLCTSFPQDSGKVVLAYAQSGSFVQFLSQTYGLPKLTSLVAAYQNQTDCLTPVFTTYGLSLDELTQKWLQQKFNIVSVQYAFSNLAPWLALGLLVLIIPFLLSLFSPQHQSHNQEEK